MKIQGISPVAALTLLFIAFKLAGIIGWSWWWVLSPLWITILAVITIPWLLIGLSFIVVFITALFRK